MVPSESLNGLKTDNESIVPDFREQTLLSVSKNESLSDEKIEGNFDPFSNRQELSYHGQTGQNDSN